MRRVLVEFVGAAGIGKSFLAARVRDALSSRGLPVVYPRLTDMDLSSRPRYTVAAAGAAGIALLLEPRSLPAYVDSLKRIAKYRIATSRRNGDGIYLCDEGIFHKMRAFRRNSRSLKMSAIADRILKYVAVPDVVVVLEAAPETIHARRSRRDRCHDAFSEASVRDDVRLLEESIDTIEHVRQAVETLRILRERVDDDDIDGIVRRVSDFVAGRFESLGRS